MISDKNSPSIRITTLGARITKKKVLALGICLIINNQHDINMPSIGTLTELAAYGEFY